MSDQPASTISDLSYRHFQGPVRGRSARWLAISINAFRLAFKNKGFWILVSLSTLPHLFIILILYLQTQAPSESPNFFFDNTKGQMFASALFAGLSWQKFFLFLMTLLLGSGMISADNQTNALMVYLSKPITKLDYLMGKFFGLFGILFLSAFLPAMVFFIFCAASYYNEGFFQQEPLLFFRMILACAAPALIHSSLMMGVSAWSKTPRIAGAVYAGIYFLSNVAANTFWALKYQGQLGEGVFERNLSVQGLINSLQQNALGIILRPWDQSRRRGLIIHEIEPPNWIFIVAIALILCFAFLLAARIRIKAVEVVRG